MTSESFDVAYACDAIKKQLDDPEPNPATDIIREQAGSMARHIRGHCASDAVGMTFGHALMPGSTFVGGWSSCPHVVLAANTQAVAGYYLLRGIPEAQE